MALAVVHGAVYAKRAAWGERIECVTEPGRFWTVIGIYSALAEALITLF